MELDLDMDFLEEDQENAHEKLRYAAEHYEAGNSKSLSCFDGKDLSPATFREMLRRVFGMKLSGRELGALVSEFDTNDTGRINCNEFIVHFMMLGFNERSERQRSRHCRWSISLW